MQSIVKYAEERSKDSESKSESAADDEDEGVGADLNDVHAKKRPSGLLTPDPAEARHALEVMTNYAYHINEVKRKHELYLSQLNELKRKQEVNPFKFIKSFMKKTNSVFVRVCKNQSSTSTTPSAK